ncbi:MAG TPA: archease [Thermodesulfobacteriota bacterium]|nr:archease [Thermodesulfobacteriota bacterium]
MDYEILDHTADVCLRVYGKSFDEILRNAARGMMDLITDREKVEPLEAIQVEAEGETREELLVHWLQEILYLHQVKKVFFHDFGINRLTETLVTGKAFGEKIDFEKHEVGSDVKGISYHNLRLETLGDRLKIDIIFDL